MPEGPELHLASLFVNRMCEGVVFTGPVEKSEVSKNPEVSFSCPAYTIVATSRGKEVRLTLTPQKSDSTLGRCRRENVLSHMSDRAFDRPICEALLNQKYFNGVGNYLRAEILFRLNIPPFVKARTVLEGLQTHLSDEDRKSVVKVEVTDTEVTDKVKEEVTDREISDRAAVKEDESETPDLLSLCHTVPLEVIKLGGKGYDPEKMDYTGFKSWLQCYFVDGMKSIRDHNGRTMWFKGDPGPMAPKDAKSPKAKMTVKKEDDHDYTGGKKVKKARSESTMKPKYRKETVQKKEVPRRRTGRRK
ncbi:endonuclease 8-like 1 isoform X2 [Salmo salar]|uniref:Endonuclease 8-like 1 isoform X2 n=1 Tax=Salmo salar TaxID=8030 RepID=A0A1S3PEQ5_SALSA|nr:endonuclease 8-like 1 isoform X2 [Salmo salar]XP_014025914.1 endonuclease 8-like 1 isoform X2 [Salmo salar]|eukprot:XP_014025913.1 PREDICTED: endonuclease 8-like 1 isoform X2 [Salmo salar]